MKTTEEWGKLIDDCSSSFEVDEMVKQIRNEALEEAKSAAALFTQPNRKREADRYWPAPYEQWNDAAKTAGHMVAQAIADEIHDLKNST